MQPLYLRFKAEYNVWSLMRQRCRNLSNQDFKHYGGRGIKVCPQWESFKTFLNDMGPRPDPSLWLGRLDVNGDFKPTNCHWTEPKFPVGNRRICHKVKLNGDLLNIVEVARRQKMYPNTFRHRLLKQGMDAQQALSSPKMRRGGPTLICWQGKTQSIAAWAREIGINPSTLEARLTRYAKPLDQAMTPGRLRNPSHGPSAS